MRIQLALGLVFGVAALVAGAVACSDSTTGDTSSNDAGTIGFDAGGPSTGNDSGDPQVEPVDAGADADASLKGVGTGLRVEFLGEQQSFGADDESSLADAFQADTALVSTRAVTITTLDAAFLANVDVVVLDRLQRAFTVAETQALFDWVNAGHGMIALGGYGGGNDTFTAGALAPFGITLSGTYVGSNVIPVIPGHAVVDGVSGLRFYGGEYVGVALDAGVTFAELNGNAVGKATTHGTGRVVTYGDEWILLDQEVVRTDDAGAKPTQRFWHNALLWVGGRID